MSLRRFEITNEHIELLKSLDWQAVEDGNNGEYGVPYLGEKNPFGDLPTNAYAFEEDPDPTVMGGDETLNLQQGSDEEEESKEIAEQQKPVVYDKVVEDAALILYGNKSGGVIDDPFQKQASQYTDEELKHARKVLTELYLALDIVFYIGEFKTGKFVTEHYMRNWREE